MSTFNFLSYHQYLYSPQSWLHANQNNYKIFCIFLQLLLIPYFSSVNIIIVLILWITILKSINMPRSKWLDLQQLCFLGLCLFLLLTYCTLNKKLNISAVFYSFPISWPIWRILSISVTYIIIIKLFLLTTYYEEIIYAIFYNSKLTNKIYSLDICFMVMISLQITHMLFLEIKQKCLAYRLRGEIQNRNNLLVNSFGEYQLVSKILLYSLLSHVHYINQSLYSRTIDWPRLYFLDIYKK